MQAPNELSDPPAGMSESLAAQPIARIVRDGVEYVLLGTAHVSRASVEAVREILDRESFDAVAVELCEPRYKSMRDPASFRNLDLFQIIRQGKAGLVAANLALSAFQRRLAEQFGIEPGAEMKAAIDGAEARDLLIWLIDREVGITLKRAIRSVGFLERLGIIGGLAGSLITREDVDESEIEKLKEGDMLGSMFSEFAKESPPLFEALIAERDRYMTARLREESDAAASTGKPVRRVLAVIGAGHLSGIEQAIAAQAEAPGPLQKALAELPPGSPWPKRIGFAVFAIIAIAIASLFYRGAEFGADALWIWVLCTGIGAAIGTFAAGGHPLSALAGFIVAPLKPFRPGVPVGAASAGVEVWIHRPRVADFDSLRDDVIHWTGWWKNRISRTLLVFVFTNLGMMFGTWVAGFRIIKSLL
ncbi:MAG TPA: TraB/GumN family protein [Dokdonella sp.]|uniref:TraB/GumN family protein n=1 Tax=Dokdonella sp. TaxID=2291710 RepID=UPI002B7D6EE6|nr:TraB/GumN family protein [Dokdonella sp.]HOX72655.1 TraB/GumN family protein [Dokdonella sp.]HPG95100.1 TraB/GumN family protein [Dokdonella sp.]HPN79939.1 TraB/GumN family protein [Dokdonella sp.]